MRIQAIKINIKINNETEYSPEVDSHIYGQLTFIKDAKTIEQGNDDLFKNEVVKIEYPYAKIK